MMQWQWYFVSIANESSFVGAVIVQARGVLTATMGAHQLGLHGGQVVADPIPEDLLGEFPVDMRNRVLSEREVRERLGGKTIAEHEAGELKAEGEGQ